MYDIVSLHNEAVFEDAATTNQGLLKFNNPYEENGIWKVVFWGEDLDRSGIEITTIEIDAQETINPSKVAKWILKYLLSRQRNDAK